MPYVRIITEGPKILRRTAEITTSDPEILAAWIMEQVATMEDGRDRLELQVVPMVIQTGTGPQDFITDWPRETPTPFVTLEERVPAHAFVRGLQSALEAFLEPL